MTSARGGPTPPDASCPPSTGIVTPVTYDASSDSEEQRGVDDVVGLADARDHAHVDERIAGRLVGEERRERGRGDDAGCDPVHPDVEAGELDREDLGHPDHRGLRHAVRQVADVVAGHAGTDQARDRRDVDDRAPTAALEHGQRVLDRQEHQA